MKNKILPLLSILALFGCNDINNNSFYSEHTVSTDISSEENKHKINFEVEAWLNHISYIDINLSEAKFINSEEQFNSYTIEYVENNERIFYENNKFIPSFFEEKVLIFFNYGHSSSFENPKISDIYITDNKLELVYEYETPIMINTDHIEDLVIISLDTEEAKDYINKEIIVTKNEIIIDNDPYTPGNQI